MIPPEDHIQQRRLYTKHGRDLWRVIAYCQEPSITMQNVLTKQRETFGLSGVTAREFEPIDGIVDGIGESIIERENP